MGVYRLYFLGEGRRIKAAEVIDAAGDLEGIELAERLADACSDECEGFELWQLDRLVARQTDLQASPRISAGEITSAMEESLLQREERIRDSRWQIAKSRRLLARIDEARRPMAPPVAKRNAAARARSKQR